MANSTTNEIQVARSPITGKLLWGPTGTAIPTDATTALNVAFVNLGHIGEDGVQPAREVTTEPVKNDNGQKLLDVQTDFSKDYTATLLQVANEAVNNAIFGDANVTATAGGVANGQRLSVADKGEMSGFGILIIEGRYDTSAGASAGKIRRVVPVAQVTAMEEGPWLGTAVQQYTTTWASSPDSSGVYDYTYRDDMVLVP
jgi:hypothetical protein